MKTKGRGELLVWQQSLISRDINHGCADRLSQSHVVSVGGIWWHRMTRRESDQDTHSLTV
jgi:hypothetical protein